MQITYFECECFSDEHTLKFTFDKENKELYTSVFLFNYEPIWKRIWTAIKYVFGYKSKYGDWDSFSMRIEDADKLIGLLEEFKKAHDEQRN